MTIAIKTLEATGFVDESGNLHLYEPLDCRLHVCVFQSS